MKKIPLLLMFMLLILFGNAQNLVSNNSFEQYTTCPFVYNDLEFAVGWINPCDPPYGTTGTQSGSSDYFNACDTLWMGVPTNITGFQPARTGNGYAGLICFYNPITPVTYREYIETELVSPLMPGANYYFEMYVNLANTSDYAIEDFGVYFSDTLIDGLHTHLPLPYLPQISNMNGVISDTTNWILISGNFQATGGERYMIIGNFNDDSNTNVVQVSANVSERAYYYIDDVSLTLLTTLEETYNLNNIKIYPSPFINVINAKASNNEILDIFIYDISSRILLHRRFANETSLNTEFLSKGFYLYKIIGKKGIIKQGQLVKY